MALVRFDDQCCHRDLYRDHRGDRCRLWSLSCGDGDRQVPGGLQLIFETVIEQIERRMERNLGIRTAPFVVPLAVSLFFFILISNWLAIVPHSWENYVRPPTSDVNLTFALSFFVIILVHLTGLRTKDKHYFRHFVRPYRSCSRSTCGCRKHRFCHATC